MVSRVVRGTAYGLSSALALTDALIVRPAETIVARTAFLVAERALASTYVEALAREAVRHRVVERVAEEVVTDQAIERVIDRVETSGAAQRVAERLLEDGIAEELAVRLLTGPELERIVETAMESDALRDCIVGALESPGAERLLVLALDSPGVERMVARIVESRIVDETAARVMEEVAARLPDSQAMWALVDEIAQSPAVTEAIAQQGYGFADQVAGEVRERSRNVDVRLERAVWRLLRRRPRAGGPGEAPSPT